MIMGPSLCRMKDHLMLQIQQNNEDQARKVLVEYETSLNSDGTKYPMDGA